MESLGPEDRLQRFTDELLRRASQHYQQAMVLFQGVMDRATFGEDVPLWEAERAVRALDAATQTIIEIRAGLDDSDTSEPEHERDDPIDLETERDRIGGLLDRLRDDG